VAAFGQHVSGLTAARYECGLAIPQLMGSASGGGSEADFIA